VQPTHIDKQATSRD